MICLRCRRDFAEQLIFRLEGFVLCAPCRDAVLREAADNDGVVRIGERKPLRRCDDCGRWHHGVGTRCSTCYYRANAEARAAHNAKRQAAWRSA